MQKHVIGKVKSLVLILFPLFLWGCSHASSRCLQWKGIERVYYAPKCRDQKNWVYCTRVLGHKGRHHAHGSRYCYQRWR